MPVKINDANLTNIQFEGANVEKVGVDGRPVFLLVGSGEYEKYDSEPLPEKFTFDTSKGGGVDGFRILLQMDRFAEVSVPSCKYVVHVRVAMNGVSNFRTFKISIIGDSFTEDLNKVGARIGFHMFNDKGDEDAGPFSWTVFFPFGQPKEILDIKVNDDGNNLLVSFIDGWKEIKLTPSGENPPKITWYNKDYPIFYVSGSTETASQGYAPWVIGEVIKTARKA